MSEAVDDFKMTRQFLHGIVAPGIDLNDQYQCHAFINLRFVCSRCGVEDYMEDATLAYPSVEWCRAAALNARAKGWFISPPEADGLYYLRAFCSKCHYAGVSPHY